MSTTKKIIKGVMIGLGLSFMLSGIIVLWFSRSTILDLIAEQKEPYDALSVGLDDLKAGDHVTVDVVLTEGYAIKKNEWLSKGNTVSYSSETRYYLVYVLDKKDGKYSFNHWVMVSKTGDFKKIDQAAKAYQAWCDGTGSIPTETVYSVEGRVVKLNKKEREALDEYFGENDYSDWVAPLVVKPLWSEWKSGKSGALAIVIAGIIMTVVNGTIFIIGLLLGRKEKKAARKS